MHRLCFLEMTQSVRFIRNLSDGQPFATIFFLFVRQVLDVFYLVVRMHVIELVNYWKELFKAAFKSIYNNNPIRILAMLAYFPYWRMHKRVSILLLAIVAQRNRANISKKFQRIRMTHRLV